MEIGEERTSTRRSDQGAQRVCSQALSLGLSGEPPIPPAQVLALAYVPLALVEASIAGAAAAFLYRVEPQLMLGTESVDD